jgi:hypothetical protein
MVFHTVVGPEYRLFLQVTPGTIAMCSEETPDLRCGHMVLLSKCQRTDDYSSDGIRGFDSFSASSRLKRFKSFVIAEVRFEITSILLQMKIRLSEKKKKIMIHISFRYSMGNSGRIDANISKIQNGW